MNELDDGLFDNLKKEREAHKYIPPKTLEGLPILANETVSAFREEMRREIFKKTGEHHHILEEWCKEIESENPVVLCYMHETVSRYPPDLQGSIFFSFVMFYHLLKSQASNDKILEYWNLK